MLHFSWITDYLAIGPQPGPELRNLKKLGFKPVIDLNANPEEAAEASRTGFEYHPVEVRDTDPVVDWLAKQARGRDHKKRFRKPRTRLLALHLLERSLPNICDGVSSFQR